jgi:hypothetical protein
VVQLAKEAGVRTRGRRPWLAGDGHFGMGKPDWPGAQRLPELSCTTDAWAVAASTGQSSRAGDGHFGMGGCSEHGPSNSKPGWLRWIAPGESEALGGSGSSTCCPFGH